MKITVQEVAYHRNGIFGEPFHAVLFQEENVPEKEGEPRELLGIVFPYKKGEPPRVAVLERGKLKEGFVTFGLNSWRGAHYADILETAISKGIAQEILTLRR